jgi:hypothetical protein
MKTVQFARGTAAQNDAFTGAIAQVTVDTTNKNLRVHDGVTPGGHPTLSPSSAVTFTNKTISFSDNTFTGVLPLANGGSGANTAAGARTAFGATTVGSNLFTLTNPSSISFLRLNADNSVSALSAADFRTAIGAGTGSGDVTTTGAQVLSNKTIALGSNTVSGTLAQFNTAVTDADFASLAGTETLTNKTVLNGTYSGTVDQTGSVRGGIVAVAALDIDCSQGNFFTKTISAASTFTFSNPPASRAYAFTLELTHTSGTVTWPASVVWPSGTAPTLTTGKVHLFTFVTDDGGTKWRGVSQINYAS